MRWELGQVIVERQVWHGVVQAAFVSVVVEATADQVISYVPTGAPFWFPDEPVYPGPTGRHPWYGRPGWAGHGKLTVTRLGCDHSVGHFWAGEDRRFACWYLNIEEPVRVSEIGLDSQDLELDLVIRPDRTWVLKDDDMLDQRVAEGRWTPHEAALIRDVGRRIVADVLETGRWWWDTSWAEWRPPPGLPLPAFPSGWLDAPVPPSITQ
jgi:hypothetical protein